MTPRADARVGMLSHGMRQRLAIARATLHAPVVLLLDEPFTGLDAAATDLLHGRIQAEASQGRVVICVTHQPADIWRLATRVVMLDRGTIVLDVPRPASLDEFVAGYRRLFAA